MSERGYKYWSGLAKPDKTGKLFEDGFQSDWERGSRVINAAVRRCNSKNDDYDLGK